MRAILLCLVLACGAHAQSVKMPAEVKLDPAVGLPVSVTIEWEGDDVSWTAQLSPDIVLFREHSADPKVVRLMLFVSRGAKEATHNLNAAACKDKKMSPFGTTRVVVGKGDAPKPPDPVDPVKPPDPVVKALKDALAACPEADKLDRANTLRIVYKGAADAIAKEGKVKTVGDLFKSLTVMYEAVHVNKTVVPLLMAINTELFKVLPKDGNAPYDPDLFKKLSADISVALAEAVKP